MITTLVMYICTTAAMDSLEPALDALRRKGYPYVAAYCEEGEE